MGTIKVTFPNGFVATAIVEEAEEPECSRDLYEMLADGPVKMECYHTLSAGGFFSSYVRPSVEPIEAGSQGKAIGNHAPIIFDFEPGDISWLGRRLCFAYGPCSEPEPVGGPVIAKVRKEDLKGYIDACNDVWFHCYIYHKLPVIYVENGDPSKMKTTEKPGDLQIPAPVTISNPPNWKEVKAELEAEIDKIWFNCPPEIELSAKGVFPSGAGTYGQAFGNLLFVFSDTYAISWLYFESPFKEMMDDDKYSLEQVKDIFYRVNFNKCRILGANHGKGSKCPAAWLNLPKFQKFFTDIYESYDSIKTKEEFKSLIWSWFNYIDRINRWVYIVFPWEVVGQQLPTIYGDAMNEEERQKAKEAGLLL